MKQRRGLPRSTRAVQVFNRDERRAPQQERARETVAAILEAAAEVFGDLGYAGATTNKIAATVSRARSCCGARRASRLET